MPSGVVENSMDAESGWNWFVANISAEPTADKLSNSEANQKNLPDTPFVKSKVSLPYT